MQLYFSGGEHPGHRKRLFAHDVTAIELNFRHLIPRLPKRKQWLITEKIPDNVSVGVAFEPEDDDELNLYFGWVSVNAERLDYAVEPIGEFLVTGQRQAILSEGVFDPIWLPDHGFRMLDTLCGTYDKVVVPQSAFDSNKPVSQRLNRLTAKMKTHFHGLGIGKADILTSTAFSSASSGSWRSAEQYGETVVWDGRTLHRFPASDKASARARWAPYIAQSGVDPDAVEADDKDALVALSIWSWLQLEAHLSLRRRGLDPDVSDNSVEPLIGEKAEIARTPSDTSIVPTGTRERTILPVMGLDRVTGTAADGSEVDLSTVHTTNASLRQCDHCDLADIPCPEYSGGASCAFDIPVQIRTKDQLGRVWNSLVEMQAKRVFMARFGEELEGSFSPILSAEIDRFARLSDAYSRAMDNRETIKLSAEVHAGAGTISRMFGPLAGQNSAALPGGPVPSEVVTGSALAILDADEVPDKSIDD